MPSDGDIIYLMKKYSFNQKYTRILLERETNHHPLWKSAAEYSTLFPIQEESWNTLKEKNNVDNFYKHLKGEFKSILGDESILEIRKLKTTDKDLQKTEICSYSVPKISLKGLISPPIEFQRFIFAYTANDYSSTTDHIELLKSKFYDVLKYYT